MFKPFEHKGKSLDESFMDWKSIYHKPYNKKEVDPWTKCRIILMNGIEVESIMFLHQFHRNCPDQEIRRELAGLRRIEHQQQKTINWLSPKDESQLEVTIGYEHVAVDLTAWLAQNEPDDYVKACLDFALLEDFDHLYRYADLLDMDHNIPSHELVKKYVEITPGRPTIAHHRHPFDHVKRPIDSKKADIQTKLNTMIITAGEQQTMNFYANIGPTYEEDLGRQLYLEIGMVEEEHVTHYGALLDPHMTWWENLLMHEYVECYLYHSFYEVETDKNIRPIWELHLQQELGHLHRAAELLKKYEKKEWSDVVEEKFPSVLEFHDTKDYVRKVLEEQVELTSVDEEFEMVGKLDKENRFHSFQKKVNPSLAQVQSHEVIGKYQKQSDDGQDYRYEDRPNPRPELTDRKKDNATLGIEPSQGKKKA